MDYSEQPPAYPPIPAFEGKPVETTKVRMSSTLGLDIQNTVLHTDEIVRLIVECRVTGIAHMVNDRTGSLERIQTLKAIDVELSPWDGMETAVLP